MDEDFQSFIVDPDLVDPGIDVSGLKTQTSTRPELLFDLPEFSGIKVDPTRDRYIRDMYEAYGPTRFVSLMTFGLVMLALPIKMYLRWIFNLQYIIAIPEWFFNIQ